MFRSVRWLCLFACLAAGGELYTQAELSADVQKALARIRLSGKQEIHEGEKVLGFRYDIDGDGRLDYALAFSMERNGRAGNVWMFLRDSDEGPLWIGDASFHDSLFGISQDGNQANLPAGLIYQDIAASKKEPSLMHVRLSGGRMVAEEVGKVRYDMYSGSPADDVSRHTIGELHSHRPAIFQQDVMEAYERFPSMEAAVEYLQQHSDHTARRQPDHERRALPPTTDHTQINTQEQKATGGMRSRGVVVAFLLACFAILLYIIRNRIMRRIL